MTLAIGIRREDLDKRGEQRVAIPPDLVSKIVASGTSVLVQPCVHPTTGTVKRAFSDKAYEASGATIQEDLTDSNFIFGLKEVKQSELLPQRAYAFFSHTHKGQEKNRPMLKRLVEQQNTLIDYELITNDQGQRIITAFTYMAGYAGMIDSLWALGQRYKSQKINSPWTQIRQSIEYFDLTAATSHILEIGKGLPLEPAPSHPLVCTFLGNGRTSKGAQEIFDLLTPEEVTLPDLPEIFAHGDHRKVYKLVTDIPELFRIRANSPYKGKSFSREAFMRLYFNEPQHFESNLDQIIPYTTLLMNCILWSPAYPRMLSKAQVKNWWAPSAPLAVIGDITCDPEGSIEFSQETWIDDPVFTYDPQKEAYHRGFDGPGISVMAVTNLPCEFSADSSIRFGQDLQPYLHDWIKADFQAESPEASGLPVPIQKAVILWKGEFMPEYQYMQAYLQ